MSGLARQLASRYFSFQQGGEMKLGNMSAIGSAHEQGQNMLAQAVGEWAPSEEGVLQMAEQASALETSTVVAREYSKELTRRNRALGGFVRVLGSHQQQAARQSLQNAKMQDQFMAGMIPLSLQMGATVASHNGRQNGLGRSRLSF